MKSSDTGGVQPMGIAGRMASERERLIGMTEEERAWRARYLKSQQLAAEEPIVPKDYYKKSYNPIRRFYRAPMDKLQNMMIPIVGPTSAAVIRVTSARMAMFVATVYGGWYYFKYNTMSWTRRSGWKISISRTAKYPGDQGYGKFQKHVKGSDYDTGGFEKSPI